MKRSSSQVPATSTATKKIKVAMEPQRPDRPMISEDDPTLLAEGSLLKPHHIHDLKTKGYTVVENVCTAEDCAQFKRDWLSTMESYNIGFSASDKKTWKTENLPMGIRGMQEWPPVAQENYVWQARLKAEPIFAQLWKTQSLISSMDRVCFVPNTRLKLNAKTQFGWMHLDQSRRARRGNLECFQGFITLNDIGASEVALEVFEGAHLHHRQFFEKCVLMNSEREVKCKNKDWLKFGPLDVSWYEAQQGVKRVRVHAKAGSLVLWDSRLPHHAMPPRNNSERSLVDRYVIYTCMVPRIWTDEKTREYRIKAFENGRGTPHWPQDKSMFNFKPQTYGNELPCKDFSVKNQLAQLKAKNTEADYQHIKKLVGY